jgi:hypothetical protein
MALASLLLCLAALCGLLMAHGSSAAHFGLKHPALVIDGAGLLPHHLLEVELEGVGNLSPFPQPGLASFLSFQAFLPTDPDLQLLVKGCQKAAAGLKLSPLMRGEMAPCRAGLARGCSDAGVDVTDRSPNFEPEILQVVGVDLGGRDQVDVSAEGGGTEDAWIGGGYG